MLYSDKPNEQKYDEMKGTLLMAQLVWRHGDRAPIDNYLSDIRYEHIWPNGWGELTEIGMQQHFELGKRLRDRYVGNLLSKNFDFRQVYIQSTDRNRTIMSALANMAGMFQKDSEGKNENTSWPKGWIPIPIHTIRDDDPEHVFSPCPRADQLEKDITRSAYHHEVVQENNEFFNLLSDKTGKKIDFSNIFDIHDTYFIERLYNLSQPEWLTENVVRKMKNLSAIDTQFDNGIGNPYVPELIRLRGGRLLKSMIERMTQKIDSLSSENEQKYKWISNLRYHALSAHDTTIYALLATFGKPEMIINDSFPQYCATLAMELWLLGDEKQPFVKILFNDGLSHNSKTITNLVEGCPKHSSFCSLETFIRRSIQFIPEDVHEECLEK